MIQVYNRVDEKRKKRIKNKSRITIIAAITI